MEKPSKLAIFMKRRGYNAFFSLKFGNRIKEELFHNKKATLSEKLWALRHGFWSGKVKSLGINKDNVNDYVSVFDYARIGNLNGSNAAWIDDKLFLRDILGAYGEYLPEYYFYRDKQGKLYRLADCPEGMECGTDGIIELLDKKGYLALKPRLGSLGEGFMRLERASDGKYLINGQEYDRASLTEKLEGLLEVIVTEYVFSHPTIRRIYEKAPNSLRLSVFRDLDGTHKLLSARIRIGMEATGYIDNVSKGGFGALIEPETGRLMWEKVLVNGKTVKLPIHPQSYAPLNITIPNWELILKKTLEICNTVPDLVWIGFDIIPTEDGFKLIELNSHQSIDGSLQHFHPLMKSEAAGLFMDAFERRKKLFKRTLRRLERQKRR